jgi:hypothetical protein
MLPLLALPLCVFVSFPILLKVVQVNTSDFIRNSYVWKSEREVRGWERERAFFLIKDPRNIHCPALRHNILRPKNKSALASCLDVSD